SRRVSGLKTRQPAGVWPLTASHRLVTINRLSDNMILREDKSRGWGGRDSTVRRQSVPRVVSDGPRRPAAPPRGDGRGLHLEQARRRSLSDTVMDQLLSQLRNGSIRPGDRLPGEHELMRMLGVGRSSVREALRALITLGLVETRPGRGPVVVARSPNPLAGLGRGADVADALQKSAVLDLLEVRE